MRVFMVYAMILIIAIVLWYPGFMLSRNMIIAVEKRKPTIGENVMAAIPFLNAVPARKALYGSAKLPLGIFIALVVTVVLNNVIGFITADATSTAMVYLEVFALYGTYISYAACWVLFGYVLMDFAKCIQQGGFTFVLCYVFPPLAQFIIGKNCIPMIAKIESDMENEEE